MAAYLIVDTQLTDPPAYEAYKLRAKPLVERFGGEYLARGGAFTAMETDLWAPTRLVVIRFPTRDLAHAFYESAEYQTDVLPIGRRSAKRTLVILDGI